jgi:hypothetical protein
MSKFIRVDGKIYMREKGLKMQEEYDKKHGKECPTCSKRFKNLQQHITKMHTHYYLEIKYNNDDLELSTLTVRDQDGKVLMNNLEVESTGWTTDNLDTITFNYELKDQEETSVRIDSNKNVELHRESYNENSGRINGRKGFKNWSYTIV